MVAEVLTALRPTPGGRYADGRSVGWSRHGHLDRQFADWMAVWVRSRWRRD